MASETIRISIPLDGSIEPCSICGSITVDLDGNPQPCSLHDFCPDCSGTKSTVRPQYCPVHECVELAANPIDSRSCELGKGHDGPCIAKGTNGLTFTEFNILGTPVDVHVCTGTRWEDGHIVNVYEWRTEIARQVEKRFGEVEVNGYPFSRWKRVL